MIEREPDGATSIGALVKIATVGADEGIRQDYPGLAVPAETLATPQIRYMGTACAHGGKGRMAWCINKSNGASVCFYLICTNMLGNAPCLALHNIFVA